MGFLLSSLFRRKRKLNAQLAKIDAMNGLEFEAYIADLLRSLGYKNVHITKASGDFGVDIVADFCDERFAFQCKCYSSNLGVKCVQEVSAGMAMYDADFGAVVTNASFTRSAKELADALGIQLIDRDELKEYIISTL